MFMIESKTSQCVSSDRLRVRIELKEVTKKYLDNPYRLIGDSISIDIDMEGISFDRLSEIANQMMLEIPPKSEFAEKDRKTRKLSSTQDNERLSEISSHSAWSEVIKTHKTNLRASQDRRGRAKKPKSNPVADLEHSMKKMSTKKPIVKRKTSNVTRKLSPVPKLVPKRRAKTYAREAIQESMLDGYSESIIEDQNALFDQSGLNFKIITNYHLESKF